MYLFIFRSRRVWTFRVGLLLSSLNAYLIISRVYVALFQSFAKHLMLFLCWIHREIASGQIPDSKYKDVKTSTSTLVYESLHRATTTAVQVAAPVPEIINIL
jgi:hypothetical protein